MKIICTADWHLGAVLENRSRAQEHKVFLDWLLTQIKEQEPDALVMSGDVFDKKTPSAEAQHLYYEFLASVTHLKWPPQVIIIAGNHDQDERLAAPAQLLLASGIEIRTGKEEDIAHAVILVRSARSEKVVGAVCALPFLSEKHFLFPPSDAHLSLEEQQKAREQLFIHFYKEYAHAAFEQAQTQLEQASAKGAPIVISAHLFAVSGEPSSSASVGTVPLTPISAFPAEAAYISLGHIHEIEQIGKGMAYYSGSPLPMKFEVGSRPRGAFLVTASSNAEAHLQKLVFTPPVLYASCKGSLGEVQEKLRELSKEPRPVYVSAEVSSAGSTGEVLEQLSAAVQDSDVEISRLILKDALAGELSFAGPAQGHAPALSSLEPEKVLDRVFKALGVSEAERAQLQPLYDEAAQAAVLEESKKGL